MKILWSSHVDEGGGDSFYGYGWVVMEMDGRKVITHNGGNGILFADMLIVPDEKLVAVIQTNAVADFPSVRVLLEQLGKRLVVGAPLPVVPDRAETMPENLERFVGAYGLNNGGEIRVTLESEELAIEAMDSRAFSALLSTRTVDSARAHRFTARIDEVVTAYLERDWKPLWEACGRSMPLGSLESRAGARVTAMIESHGPVKGHEVLGTAFREGRDVTLVRIDLERGEVYRAYVWDPQEEESLLGVSGRGLDHVIHVFPEKGGTFSSWDARIGLSRPVRFDVAEDGSTRLWIGSDKAFRALLRK
jgi:hypothetical protein